MISEWIVGYPEVIQIGTTDRYRQVGLCLVWQMPTKPAPAFTHQLGKKPGKNL
jgi:hypothetical protein